jgi:hypothetical protein
MADLAPCRKLQHRCPLTGTQLCEKRELAVGKFQRVMVRVGPLIDLPETREPRPDAPKPHLWKELRERMIAYSILAKGKFGTWQETYSGVRLSNRGEPTRHRIGEFTRQQHVPRSCGTRSDGMQAVVTHQNAPPSLFGRALFGRKRVTGVSGTFELPATRFRELLGTPSYLGFTADALD